VEAEGEERLVIVHEVERHPRDSFAAIADALRRAVAEEHEVQAHDIVLLRPGSIPKTSSGKIQRHACRAGYALVSPASSLGGIPAIYANKHGIPIVAVHENRTILGVPGEKLGLNNVIEVDNYVEAAGVLLALRKGIHLQSVRRPLPTLRHGLESGRAVEKRFRLRFA
jgi:uncharacterized protein DUF3326